MEGEVSGEFQDWELLVNSDTDMVHSPNSVNNSRNLEEIEADSEGVLRLDYFSLENDSRYAKTAAVVDASDEGSVESDNPSWIDPGPETRYNQITNSGEFWSDSGSDRSDERKASDFDVKNELGVVDNVKMEGGFQGIGEIECKDDTEGKFESFEGSLSNLEGKNEMGFEESLKNEMGTGDFVDNLSMDKDLGESNVENSSKEDNLSVVAVVEKKSEGDEEKRKVVWWKVPFELLRYCVFRISPVWTFSMAAAVMGFVILGRRLYKMKRKTRSLPLKVTVDDKKVSQFMSRAARLNEAFSVVRRVPIVRPLLPAGGVNSWPVMTLR
ncbi:uncharacterized protein LOC8277156 [Ricinus communis]|uniref:DUF6821 domain-containing protein n=1 Tax=Ricinus communis TaxID=3988 RepID=B9SHN5_RICCO|nr:uncharacterized protein LOC8277156 [Ricinus communis]EEF36862.1 conserved hypothetical protein [Ricinus communis]|eukprot:XP_002525504.1 uncharacterized protein LOC8277156 [Ricinus communis]